MAVVGRSNVLLRGSCERLWGGGGRTKGLSLDRFSLPLKQIEPYSRFGGGGG